MDRSRRCAAAPVRDVSYRGIAQKPVKPPRAERRYTMSPKGLLLLHLLEHHQCELARHRVDRGLAIGHGLDIAHVEGRRTDPRRRNPPEWDLQEADYITEGHDACPWCGYTAVPPTAPADEGVRAPTTGTVPEGPNTSTASETPAEVSGPVRSPGPADVPDFLRSGRHG